MKAKNFNVLLLLIIILMVSITSCKKEQQRLRNGVYVGNFGYYTNDSLVYVLKPVFLEIKNGKYFYKSDWNSQEPYQKKSGKITIKQDNLSFHNEYFKPTESWPYFDYIDGVFNYSFNGKQLKLWRNDANSFKVKYDLYKY